MTQADMKLGLSHGEIEPEVVLARSADYLLPLCAGCGGRVEVRYLGAAPFIPAMRIGCPACGTDRKLKLNGFFREFPKDKKPHNCIGH